jgi:deoxyribonuclease-4
MKLLGAHVSTAGGVHTAPERARALGANAFAIFTRNQRRWAAKPLADDEAAAFREQCAAYGFPLHHVLPHAGYLINLGAPDAEIVRKSQAGFLNELERCRRLGLRYLNFHPGSHLGKMDDAACMAQITSFLNRAIAEIPEVIAVYECTAGQGSHLGHSFEQLAGLIEGIEDKSRIGVCLDTCHLHAAGYDLTTAAAYEHTMQEFEQVVGLRYLAGAHLNDSKTELGSRVDRHASLGQGTMGWEPFRLLMNDPRFDDLPLITETVDQELWAEELVQLRALAGQRDSKNRLSSQPHA